MPYLVDFFGNREGNVWDQTNQFLYRNYKNDPEFEPVSMIHLSGAGIGLMYKCSETNENYINFVKTQINNTIK